MVERLKDNGPEGLVLKRKITRQIMLVSGGFIVILSLLLLLNYLHLELYDPLDNQAMEQLVNRLADDPDNDALKNDIRNLDLLARKAYFNSTWQINAGSYLLLFASILFIASMRVYAGLNSRIGEPDQSKGGEVLSRIISRKWILYTGAGILLLAYAGSLLTHDFMNRYQAGQASPGTIPAETEAVEVVTLTGTEGEKVAALPDSGTKGPEATDIAKTGPAVSSSMPEAAESRVFIPVSAEKIRKMHGSFRGAFGLGVSDRKGIPVDWDGASGKNVLWKAAVPKPGYNSPVIWGDRLFISGGDAKERLVYCFDKNTGKLLWQESSAGIEGSPAVPPKTTDDTGLSAPTLAVDDNGVFAIFATGDIIAFDLEGKRLWALNLGVPVNHYGHSSSLLLWDGKLFVQYDTNKGGRMLALSVLDGSVIWEIRRDNKISWSSPVLISREGKYEIVTSSDPYVAAYDPSDGHQIWAVSCMMGEVAPSVAWGSGLVFAGNEYATLAAIKPGANPEIVWQNDEYLPEVSSPVASDGLLYMATSYGVLVCYDAKTGEKYWEKEYGSGFYSSPMIADGKVYIIDMGGVMHIIKAGKEGTVIGEPALGEKAFATPAFSDGRIYLRGASNLYCIGK